MSTTTPDATPLLASVDLFAGLSEKKLRKLAAKTRETVHPAGAEVTAQGQGGMAFYVIASGSADVVAGGQVVKQLGPGDYFGEVSMIDGKARTATVTATADLTTVTVPRMVFEDLLTGEPQVARRLLVVLAGRLREFSDQT
jgi:CRP-like cAMP-binding protein